MATMTEIIDGCKSSPRRTVRWTPATDPDGHAAGLLEVHAAGRATRYAVVELVAGKGFAPLGGRAFRLEKDTGEVYDVFLPAAAHEHHTCDCAAGCYGKVAECRHVAAVKAVLANGWLPQTEGR